MIRVASVPASHPYVRHLSRPDGADPVTRLPDPVPRGGGAPGVWWPPLMLEPAWIRDNHDAFDVFHLHFGFDAISTDTLLEVVEELARHHKPLIYTVHDLRNPHHRDPAVHDKHLDILVPAARELITLTPGAAGIIGDRWGRTATVLPHPHVLDSAQITQPRRRSSGFVVGVHVKSLRANMDPFPVLDTLVGIIGGLDGATLQIDAHEAIFEPGNHYYAPDAGARLLRYADHPHVAVRVHPYFTDDELWQYISSLSASILPYRFGTHSGWLEACYDLGTEVVTPSCGFYDQQRPCEVYDFTEASFGAESLGQAIRTVYERALAQMPAPRADWDDRRAERVRLADAHAALYEHALR